MLNSTDFTGWAQIGYFNRNVGGTDPIYFWQWMKDNSVSNPRWATMVFGNPQTGVDRNFRVERLGVDDVIHMYVSGNEPCVGNDCAETPFDPLMAWDGLAAEWFGETQWGGSDVPGTSSNKVNFDNVMVKDTSNNWSSQAWTASSADKCFYKIELVNNSSHFRIWTHPLDHSC